VKLKPVKLAPALIAVCVILLVCVLRLLQPDFLERPELMTYDMRVRQALQFNPPVATNLGFVEISDRTIDEIRKGLLGTSFGLYWPRQVYGRLIRELTAQQVKVVGLDIIFAERRIDHGPIRLSLSRWPEAMEFATALHEGTAPATYEDGNEKLLLMDSDDYFAWQLRRANNVILAADKGVQPHPLFATNTLAVADISANRDPDGVLRRVRAFQTYTNWHRIFQVVENDPAWGVNLQKAGIEGTNVVLYRAEGLDPIRLPLDADGNFALGDALGEIPPGWPPRDKPFTTQRIWHMGVRLAAAELHLDLENTDVDLVHGRITLRGDHGFQRTIPVDREGYFYINWEMPYSDPRVTRERMEDLLLQDLARSEGATEGFTNRWAHKLAVVGSQTVGNDLKDRGATPLEKDTLLVSEHWNVANSILNGRFIRRSSLSMDLLLIVALGTLTALLTWQLRILVATGVIAILLVAYGGVGLLAYAQHRYWLPLIFPMGGGMLLMYVSIIVWRVLFEQADKRRVKSVFGTVVSPKIMTELLKVEELRLGGAHRRVTVLFADVRGFTEFTDTNQEKAAAYIADRKLSDKAAESHYNEVASETLGTVNLYLGVVAETILQHDATLDKFIGDCVMAFWGAPVPTSNHAVECVRAAIEAQRAVYELNLQRATENKRREVENPGRLAIGLEPRPMLPLLLLGTGINTGAVMVGMMGSETKEGILRQGSYTVFGREVNLASRLEGLSGRGRIFISEATYEEIRRDDFALAATCVLQPVAKVKGIGAAVKVFEVPWARPGTTPPAYETSAAAPANPAPAQPEKPQTAV
jgi:class 3 adenylate cyclase/CHASE2 domain-containing sensor protein